MNVLLDTNILGRMIEVRHAQHRIAHDAADALGRRGDAPCLVPQVLYELWAVATRPTAANGLGFTPNQAAAELARLQGIFPLLPDTPDIFPEWQRLVVVHQVSGKPAHDARLVAAMAVHGVTHILTFNTQDFARYPGIAALDPAAVAAPPPPPNP
jgi:predicted nucleic acid-binding protein